MSLDGSTLDVADTAENDKAFGRPGTSRGASAFPKIRFVALLENGTHVLWGAHMDPYATDELTLAEKVIPALRQGMLCMADRFFPSYKLWRRAAKTAVDLLWADAPECPSGCGETIARWLLPQPDLGIHLRPAEWA